MFLDPNAILIFIFVVAIILGVVGAIAYAVVTTALKTAWNSWENAIRKSIDNLTK